MIVYLIRHAHAVDAEDDAARPLSDRGRLQVRALADFLARSGAFQPAEIWHSPLVRARETADLLTEHLNLAVPHTAMPDLTPDDDPRAIVRRLKSASHAVAVVGHEPHLSALATLLVVGLPKFPVFLMKKCAIVALEGAGDHWSVVWHVSPDVIR